MAYSTQADLEFAAGGADKLVECADWDGDGVADASVIAKAIANADGELDAYLRVRYATPIANPTATLTRLSAEEALYQIRRSKGMLTTEDEDRRKERIGQPGHVGQYDLLRDGKIRPDEPLPASSTAVRASWRERDTDGEGMSRTGLKGAW